jgi:hypothetical protein
MIKDLFEEMMRRMDWAKNRNLEIQINKNASEYSCSIPIDESVSYTVSMRSMKDPGVLIRSFFPDGEIHHYIKLERIELDEAVCMLHAACLLTYGRPTEVCEAKSSPQAARSRH